MSGYVAISREMFDHPLFAGERFSRRDAWSWMIAVAAWKATKTSVGGRFYQLERGQLVYSERFLAEKWKWDKSRVRRFLRRLECDMSVHLKPDRDATLITICNYEKYQSKRTTERTTNEPPANHQRTKEEEYNHLTKDGDGGARERAMSIAVEIGRLCGHPTAMDWPPSFMGAPMRIEVWLSKGWTEVNIMGAVKETLAKKRDGAPGNIAYFEKPIARFIERNSAPLPEPNGGKIGSTSGNIIVAQDRLIASLAKFNEPPPELRGGEGENTVRMLPKG